MVNNAAIAEAIADLDTQESRNYAATARKYNVDVRTLQRRFIGETTESGLAHLESQGNLSITHEKMLVERINTLSARGMPPTPQFVKNLVAEMTEKEVGDHWVSRFVKRQEGKLLSIYLENIDYARRVADNGRHFKHYFDQVGLIFRLFFSNYIQMSLIFGKLEEKIRKYRIKPSNIWNMDEKGFLIGIIIMIRKRKGDPLVREQIRR